MFQQIYTSQKMMLKYLKLVSGFGRKFSSFDEDFMAFYSASTLPVPKHLGASDRRSSAQNDKQSVSSMFSDTL